MLKIRLAVFAVLLIGYGRTVRWINGFDPLSTGAVAIGWIVLVLICTAIIGGDVLNLFRHWMGKPPNGPLADQSEIARRG